MNYSSSNRGFPAGNPIANALVVIVGALAIGASIVLGFVAFLILSCIVLVFAAIIGIRVWWFNRKLRKTGAGQHRDETTVSGQNEVFEGEYRVVDRRTRDNGDGESA